LHEGHISFTNHPLCTGDSYRTKPKCLVINPERVALITFQLLVNAWTFHDEYSHESFISLILGGKLLHTSFLCLHHCCIVAASCCTQGRAL